MRNWVLKWLWEPVHNGILVGIGVVVFVWFFLFSLLFFIRKQVKELKKVNINQIQFRQLFFVLISFLAAGAPFATLFLFVDVRMRPFFLKTLETIVNTAPGAGFFYGFLTTLTVGFGYFFVVASFVFKDKQRRVAAMTGFLTGQFLMFTSVYAPRLHRELTQPHFLILLFLGSFFVQLFLTSRQTLDNEEFFDPEELIILQRRRVLRLQLEFMMSFFAQICNSYLEPDSLLPRLINLSVSSYDKAQNVLFIQSAFVSWVVGHFIFIILFIQLFEFIAILILWLRRNFFDK